MTGDQTQIEWSSDAEMMRPLENIKQVTTSRPWAGQVRCLGSGLSIHRVRVRYLDLNSILYGLTRDNSLGWDKPALCWRRISASTNASSESPPNHNSSLFSRLHQRTGLVLMVSRHDLETHEACVMQFKGRKLRILERIPGGSSIAIDATPGQGKAEWPSKRNGLHGGKKG